MQFGTTDVQSTATNTPGISVLNLRGLGPNRNLVLVNGRRAQPANVALVVDVNTIPAAAINFLTGPTNNFYFNDDGTAFVARQAIGYEGPVYPGALRAKRCESSTASSRAMDLRPVGRPKARSTPKARSARARRRSATDGGLASGGFEQTLGSACEPGFAGRQRQRFARHRRCLRCVAALELHLAHLYPQRCVVRVDAQRTLQRRNGGRVIAGSALAAALREQRRAGGSAARRDGAAGPNLGRAVAWFRAAVFGAGARPGARPSRWWGRRRRRPRPPELRAARREDGAER
jgi:hypothetical protein